MTNQHHDDLKTFLDILGLTEEPAGIFFTDAKPAEGFSPKPMALPTREKEMKTPRGKPRGIWGLKQL